MTQDTITRMTRGETIIEQTDTPDGKIAQTIQRPDGSDYVRHMPGVVEIDLRSLQTLLEISELFGAVMGDGMTREQSAEFEAATEQARESLMQPELIR